ncbi:MAG: hypothetical protein V4721_03850 [Bacteroidota bacterium]
MKSKQELDINTEVKMKNAARVVFHKIGFAANGRKIPHTINL